MFRLYPKWNAYKLSCDYIVCLISEFATDDNHWWVVFVTIAATLISTYDSMNDLANPDGFPEGALDPCLNKN